VMGERWRALTPEEKKRYEDMAAEDKVRFQMESQQYQAGQVAHDHHIPPEHLVQHPSAAQATVPPPAPLSADQYAQHVDPQQQHMDPHQMAAQQQQVHAAPSTYAAYDQHTYAAPAPQGQHHAYHAA